MKNGTLEKKIKNLDSIKDTLLDLSRLMLKADGGNFFPVDIYASGIIKRSLSITEGFSSLCLDKNYLCAGALLRLQIDNCIRFYAVFIVDDPHDFCTKVLAGKHVRKLKDKNGKPMTDHYLIENLNKEFDWLERVYDSTSGYIHFSDRHMKSIFSGFEEINRIGNIRISATDDNISDKTWEELIDAYYASCEILFRYLRGWIRTKDNPNLVEKNKKD